MNRIKVVGGQIECACDSSIEYYFFSKTDQFLVDSLKIKIKEDTDLELIIEDDEKIDIFINVLEGVKTKICEYIFASSIKVQYKYYLETDSEIEVKKINKADSIKEYDIINLNGENAKFKRVLKTVSVGSEKYDMLVYHNCKNTISDLINHGVNILEGTLTFNISTFVPENISGCYANQGNRIINLTESKCQICPNMYIDCFDVVANHNAFIGTFKEEELFYLQSRGITVQDATKLLIKGFLTSELDDAQKEKFKDIINKYWG